MLNLENFELIIKVEEQVFRGMTATKERHVK